MIIYNQIIILTPQKHLELVLFSKFDFNQHIYDKINKRNKSTGIKQRLPISLSRKNLLTIYNFFVGLLLDYSEIIYDKPFNESCKSKLEAVQ